MYFSTFLAFKVIVTVISYNLAKSNLKVFKYIFSSVIVLVFRCIICPRCKSLSISEQWRGLGVRTKREIVRIQRPLFCSDTETPTLFGYRDTIVPDLVDEVLEYFGIPQCEVLEIDGSRDLWGFIETQKNSW